MTLLIKKYIYNHNKYMYLYTLILILSYYFLNLLFRLKLKKNHYNNNKYNVKIFLYIKRIYIVQKFKKKKNSYTDLCKIIMLIYYNDI